MNEKQTKVNRNLPIPNAKKQQRFCIIMTGEDNKKQQKQKFKKNELEKSNAVWKTVRNDN